MRAVTLAATLLSLMCLCGLVGCEKGDPADDAADAIGDAADDAADAVNDATGN